MNFPPPWAPSPSPAPANPITYQFVPAFTQTSILSYVFGIMGGIGLIVGLYYADNIVKFCRTGRRGSQTTPQSFRSAGFIQNKEEDGVPVEIIEALPLRTFLRPKQGVLKVDECPIEHRGSCLSVVVILDKKESSKMEELICSPQERDAHNSKESEMHLPGQVQAASHSVRQDMAQASSSLLQNQASLQQHMALNAEADAPLSPRDDDEGPRTHSSKFRNAMGDSAAPEPNASSSEDFKCDKKAGQVDRPAQSISADTEGSTEAADSDTTCIVCLLDYEDGDILRQLPCKHDFHKDCIDSWMKHHQTCPICRKELVQRATLNPNESVIEMSRAVLTETIVAAEAPEQPANATASATGPVTLPELPELFSAEAASSPGSAVLVASTLPEHAANRECHEV
ncbi:hypothetical protein CEUSTIGMA_g6085.t1 [Chlamydomonas eustigma]|uniref:RING-type domain-containing protein n=1 Tax=Chlamydomonas eustigma TaxID=1157962 RepID=A0A250X6F3_9CHLO|nr:hypothetical protein CEUSTIGMA_g6085.t1 [Chlamydomonas eustigma]|eukprot:GAX78647.1 hypothetical protein CEUSTIGMA_g6085.t1 [Chlamydomonas eustigma]